MTPKPVFCFVFLFCLFSLQADDDTSPLHDAVYSDETAKVIQLLSAGADPDAKNRYGVTVLFLACQNGNAKVVDALLEAGADPNIPIKGGESPLMTAARTGRIGPVEALLRHGAAVDFAGVKGQTALIFAAAEGHAEAVRKLTEAGADPNRKLASGFTPLLFAARNGHPGVVKVLLEAGVDPGYVIAVEKSSGKAPPSGTSALRIAVENGHFELATLLLEAGSDPDDQRSGSAPLHVLTWVRKPNRGDGDDGLPPPAGSGNLSSLEFARILVEKFHADVNCRLKSGSSGGAKFGTRKATPFLLAARTADLPYLKLLKDLGADPSLNNDDGTTPFLAAAGVGSLAPEEEAGTESERLETLAWLIEKESDVNYVDKKGETAMHGAAYKNIPEVARWLSSRGADIAVWNTKNKFGWTPLLIAQGFRSGNFKPSAATIDAIETLMREKGITPPPPPERVNRKKREKDRP